MIRLHVYLHESLTRDRDPFAPPPMMALELPHVPRTWEHIDFAESDPNPFGGRVLEIQRLTWYSEPTEDGAVAEIHMRNTTR